MSQSAIARNELPEIGMPIGGGFYTGIIQINGEQNAIITAPKKYEIHSTRWGVYDKEILADSICDSRANTIAMAEAGSEAAARVIALKVDGINDWSIPARDVCELQYRNLKPGIEKNLCSFRDGDNPSSIPPGTPYKKNNPTRTTVVLFMTGNAEAFDPVFYWSSSHSSAYTAYVQGFETGTQGYGDKINEFRVRPVRSLLII